MKVKLSLIVILCALLFSSCGDDISTSRSTYPQLSYRVNNYETEIRNKVFPLDENYVLDEGHPYDKVETEEGYDLVFHFRKDNSIK